MYESSLESAMNVEYKKDRGWKVIFRANAGESSTTALKLKNT